MTDKPTSQSSQDIRDWNRIAHAYMRTAGTPEDHIYQQFKDVLWESLGDLRGLDVLDVGCGHGWLSQLMLEAGAGVMGVDGSQTLLETARSRHPGIEFTQFDLARGLPQFDREFDRIVANMVMMDIPDIGPLVAAIRRVMKPQARFMFTLPHPCFFNYKTRRDESGHWYRMVTGYLKPEVWRIGSYDGHNHYHRSLTYYCDHLRKNRLAVTRLFEPTHIPKPSDDEVWEAFLKTIPVFLFFEAMPLA
jgi:SAM-dependent methyltransferase